MTELTKEELILIDRAQSKWMPVILQSYSTSVLDMMASPLKKSLLYLSVYCLCVYLFIFVIRKNKNLLNSNVLYIIMGGVIIFCATYYNQWKLNQNLLEVALRSENRLQSKQFDFKNNMVVQGDLLRGSMNSSSSLIDMATSAYVLNDVYKSKKRRK